MLSICAYGYCMYIYTGIPGAENMVSIIISISWRTFTADRWITYRNTSSRFCHLDYSVTRFPVTRHSYNPRNTCIAMIYVVTKACILWYTNCKLSSRDKLTTINVLVFKKSAPAKKRLNENRYAYRRVEQMFSKSILSLEVDKSCS